MTENGKVVDVMSFSYSALATVFYNFDISNFLFIYLFILYVLSFVPSGQADFCDAINYFLGLVALMIFSLCDFNIS